MVDTTLHALSAAFAIVAATGAGVLSVLAWRVLRESPFGTVIALLSATMSGLIAYHVVLFALGSESLLLDTFRSALQTVLAVFLWLVIATHEQLQDSVVEGQ